MNNDQKLNELADIVLDLAVRLHKYLGTHNVNHIDSRVKELTATDIIKELTADNAIKLKPKQYFYRLTSQSVFEIYEDDMVIANAASRDIAARIITALVHLNNGTIKDVSY